jgi:hypothetical protein
VFVFVLASTDLLLEVFEPPSPLEWLAPPFFKPGLSEERSETYLGGEKNEKPLVNR